MPTTNAESGTNVEEIADGNIQAPSAPRWVVQ